MSKMGRVNVPVVEIKLYADQYVSLVASKMTSKTIAPNVVYHLVLKLNVPWVIN